MELDIPRTLDALRQQNQTLLDQLRSRQSTMKGLLSQTLHGTQRLSETKSQNEVEITKTGTVNFPSTANDSHNHPSIHLYTQQSADQNTREDLSVDDRTRASANPGLTSGTRYQTPGGEEPMQSILKHRKIIDDNVRVESQCPVTPTHSSRSTGGRNLNFSYSEVDDLDMIKKLVRNQLEIDMALEDSLPGSRDQRKDVDSLLQERRLTDSGNDRKHSAIIRELSTRPKSIVFDETAPQGREKFDGSSLNGSRTRTMTSQRDGERPLLGYDFIAGLLDNESMLVDQSDAFYDELNEFRRVNKDECTGKAHLENFLDLTRPISPEIRDPGHTCVHGYNVNERLYPEPLNEDPDGRSVCPVCLTTRRDPSEEQPAYVRVSIPRSTLQAPYKVKPHRRRSFDDTDNFALGKHCLAGWECSKPSMMPTASTVDLKQAANGLRAKLTTTIQDIDAITASYKRIPRPETLLDTSRSYRAAVQYSAMKPTISVLHSTAY